MPPEPRRKVSKAKIFPWFVGSSTDSLVSILVCMIGSMCLSRSGSIPVNKNLISRAREKVEMLRHLLSLNKTRKL